MDNDSPVFNEVISFDISSGNEIIEVLVFDQTGIGSDNLIGECRIPLDSLRDQYKHDDWFELIQPQKRNEVFGKVRLNLHWIHSRKQFL